MQSCLTLWSSWAFKNFVEIGEIASASVATIASFDAPPAPFLPLVNKDRFANSAEFLLFAQSSLVT
jgi:hypothetical protein